MIEEKISMSLGSNVPTNGAYSNTTSLAQNPSNGGDPPKKPAQPVLANPPPPYEPPTMKPNVNIIVNAEKGAGNSTQPA